jgi:hypothetical protein
MKSRKKQKRSGGESNPESCKETKLKFVCRAQDHGKTEFCKTWDPTSVCYSEKCYTPANCIYPTNPDTTDSNAIDPNAIDSNAIDSNAIDPNAIDPNAIDPNAIDPNAIDPNAIDPSKARTENSGSNNLINGVVGVAGLGAMYMGYKWLNKKKASSDDSSSPEKRKTSRRKRKTSRRKRKSSRRKSISHR